MQLEIDCSKLTKQEADKLIKAIAAGNKLRVTLGGREDGTQYNQIKIEYL